jgi:threonine synthase
MTMAITKAVEEGSKAVICASTGQHQRQRRGLRRRGRDHLRRARAAGQDRDGQAGPGARARRQLLQVEGNFDDCLALASKLAIDYPVSLVNSVNQFRIEGQKTASFEIVDVLGDAPDIHCLPVGNAGNITAYWQGYREYAADGIASRTPRMWGFQAAGRAPIVTGQVVENPSTIATAIRIGNPRRGPRRWPPATSPAAASTPSPTARSCRLPAAGPQRGRSSSSRLGRLGRRPAAGGRRRRARARSAGRLHRDRQRAQGPGVGDLGAPAPVTIPVDAAAAAAQLGL